MKHVKAYVAAMLLILSAFWPAFAAQPIIVATGSPSGAYSGMFKDIQARCGKTVSMKEVNTDGSNTNLDGLARNNTFNAAFSQTDVLFFRKNAEDMSGVKTLVALHPEEVHVITLREGVKTGILSRDVIKDISQLKGMKVAASGGGITTANIVRVIGGFGFSVVQTGSFAESKKLLNNGDVQAIIAVGGAPLADVNALGDAYSLVGFSAKAQAALGKVYVPAKLSYRSMNMNGIPTVASEALLVVRNYKSATMVASLKTLRQCIRDSVPELQEVTGTHPKWQSVKVDNVGKWDVWTM